MHRRSFGVVGGAMVSLSVVLAGCGDSSPPSAQLQAVLVKQAFEADNDVFKPTEASAEIVEVRWEPWKEAEDSAMMRKRDEMLGDKRKLERPPTLTSKWTATFRLKDDVGILVQLPPESQNTPPELRGKSSLFKTFAKRGSTIPLSGQIAAVKLSSGWEISRGDGAMDMLMGGSKEEIDGALKSIREGFEQSSPRGFGMREERWIAMGMYRPWFESVAKSEGGVEMKGDRVNMTAVPKGQPALVAKSTAKDAVDLDSPEMKALMEKARASQQKANEELQRRLQEQAEAMREQNSRK